MTSAVEWYKRRRYVHFDLPISEDSAAMIAKNPGIVSHHAFYPLIRFVITSKKVKWEAALNRLVTSPKERAVSYASHVDSHIYAYYASIISSKYEDYLKNKPYEKSVLAFRQLGKSNIHFARDAFSAIKSIGDSDVITADISDFFGNLDHQILKKTWCTVLGSETLPLDHYNIFKSLTKFSWVDRLNLYSALGISRNNPKNSGPRICEPETFRKVVRGCKLIQTNPAPRGIPQGSPISALLSNIYMTGFDEAMWSATSSSGGSYFRYCDDMLVVVPKGQGKSHLELIEKFAALYKLPLHPKKTEERVFTLTADGLTADRALQYLGFMFDGKRIILRSASLARYSDRMRRGVRLARSTMRCRNDLRIERGESPIPLRKRKLYKRYSYLGRRNFVSYALRAADILGSNSIKRQVKPLWKRLRKQMG